MNRHIWLLMIVLLFSLFWSLPAQADGKAWGVDRSGVRPLRENEQRALIQHQNGIQKMILAIHLDMETDSRAVWMFPVPGKPTEVNVDLWDQFPEMRGYDSILAVREYVSIVYYFVRATQIYPMVTCIVLTGLGSKGIGGDQSLSVHVVKEVNKYGMTTKAIQADSISALADYFRQNQVNMPTEQLATFEPYLKGDYLFIVTWITSPEELKKVFPELSKDWPKRVGRRPCVYVQFPTPEIFYPMRPTAGYGKEIVPLTLYVLDYVQPASTLTLKNKLICNYFRLDDDTELPPEFIDGTTAAKFRYTRITSRLPAEKFKEDLRFVPAPAYRQRFYDFLADVPTSGKIGVGMAIALFLIAVLSYVSSGIAGLWLHGQWGKYAKLGFYNLLTLIAYYWAVRRMFPSDPQSKINNQNNKVKRQELVFVFSITFVLLTIILQYGTLYLIPESPYFGNLYV